MVIDHGLEAATILLPAEVAATVLGNRWSRNLVMTQISSTYSKDTLVFENRPLFNVVLVLKCKALSYAEKAS